MAPDNPETELAEATDELYGLDPADFVPARNDLVRRLRKDKKRELATEVAALRRPTPAAWALNQLVRHQRDELDGLLRLGEALRVAQTRTLAGSDAATLRDAGRARRQAIAQLADTAVANLAERGQGGSAHLTEITATLEAASLDPHAAAEMAGGRLTSALEPPSGFGDLEGDAVGFGTAAAAPVPEGNDDEAADTGRTATEATWARADAERAVEEATVVATDLLADARDAADLAKRRGQEVADAEAEVSRLQRDLDEARGRVTANRRGADRAMKAADAAEAVAAEAVDRRLQAGQRLAGLTDAIEE